MRKTLFKFVCICSLFSLTACDFLASFINGGGENNNNNNNPPTPVAKVQSVTIEDNTVYTIGDTYNINNVVITAHYDDNSTKTVPSSSATINRIYNPLNQQITTSTQFEYVGEYRVDFRVAVDNKTLSTHINFDVASGFETAGFTMSSVEYVNSLSFHEGETVRDRLVDMPLLIHWNKGTEHYTYNINTDTSGMTFRVKKQGDPTTEYINAALENGSTYELILSYQTYSLTTAFTVGGNYYRLNSSDIVNIQTDLDDSISPSKGDVKMLVIPITLSGSWLSNWTTASLNAIDGYYFGTDSTKMSLKMYYETASFGQMTISGKVTTPYVETSSSLTTNQIQADTSYTKLFTLISNAVEYVKANDSSIDFDDYDLNDDGVIDNIHLITNFDTTQYSNAWNTPLWPHKYQTGNTAGTPESPVANVYSISAIDHVQDCVTAIHEQGHIFGLDDYYDYSGSDIDYIGFADMQSFNIFDWNSFSKFSVGWISPYVITGPTEITIQAASINGDCLVIPANPETFNNSAFDEYFMIELFAPYGNNAVNYPVNGVYQGSAWDYYSNHYDLGDYGVRMYHVNDQMYRYTGSGFVEFNGDASSYYVYRPTDNDALDYDGRSSYFADWANYKELAIIQRGGVDTFGSTASGARHFLNSEDLFHQGDVFTFNQYRRFLTKDSTLPTTMNNGETFPYKITFTAMSATQVTVKIEYV